MNVQPITAGSIIISLFCKQIKAGCMHATLILISKFYAPGSSRNIRIKMHAAKEA
jgi:hypothetical protein